MFALLGRVFLIKKIIQNFIKNAMCAFLCVAIFSQNVSGKDNPPISVINIPH